MLLDSQVIKALAVARQLSIAESAITRAGDSPSCAVPQSVEVEGLPSQWVPWAKGTEQDFSATIRMAQASDAGKHAVVADSRLSSGQAVGSSARMVRPASL